jgi:hypothetical protein
MATGSTEVVAVVSVSRHEIVAAQSHEMQPKAVDPVAVVRSDGADRVTRFGDEADHLLRWLAELSPHHVTGTATIDGAD